MTSTKPKQLKHELPTPPGHEILRVEVGSTLHGIDIGSDDLDLMGVTIEPRHAITGLGKFEHYTWRTAKTGERSGPDDVDMTIYGLKKYMSLACGGNPTIISLLFAPESHIKICTDIGEELMMMRNQIVSFQCKNRFIGYLRQQRYRAENDRPSGKGRREGREFKWGSHMVRLGFEGLELLSSGHLTLPMPAKNAEVCRQIKRGEISIEQAIELSKELENQINQIELENSPLPEKPDTRGIEMWMHSVYLRNFWRDNQTAEELSSMKAQS